MLNKISPDKERAKSLVKMAKLTENYLAEVLKKVDIGSNQTIFAKDYYDIIRELATAILFLDGFKTIGENAHKETIDYLKKFSEITAQEIFLIQDLRIRRNLCAYEGKLIEGPYFEHNLSKFDIIITKLNKIITFKLGD